MNFLRDNKIQKLAACFLLAVFIFINAVKTFHTHDFSYAAQQQDLNKNATSVHTNFFCAICDFHFFKDSDIEVAVINIASPVHFVKTFFNYLLPTAKTSIINFSVRGPPSYNQ